MKKGHTVHTEKDQLLEPFGPRQPRAKQPRKPTVTTERTDHSNKRRLPSILSDPEVADYIKRNRQQ